MTVPVPAERPPSLWEDLLEIFYAPRAVFERGSSYSALHFAAHAVTDRQAPMNSALVLSPESSSRTGWMTAREIYALKLDAALVTLSSCRSSAGPNPVE